MKRRCFIAAIFLFSGLIYAESTSIDVDNIFLASDQDLSIHYLRQIFGAVGNQLSGSGTQIVGQMLGVFNLGMIIFAGGFVSYTVFNSVINAANDGGGMQGKMSAWIPFRIVTGVALLIPQFNGYSMIQVTVMWAVLQGIGLADNVWNTALNYIKNTGGAVYTQAGNQTYDDLKNLNKIGPQRVRQKAYPGDFFRSGICLGLYNKQLNANSQLVQSLSTNQSSGITADSTTPTGQVLMGQACKTSQDNVVCFGTAENPTACGSYTWETAGLNNPEAIEGTYNDVSASTTMGTAIQTLAIMMYASGKEVVDAYYDFKQKHQGDPDASSQALNDLKCNTLNKNLSGYCQPGSSLVAGSASFIASTQSLRQTSDQDKEDDGNVEEDDKTNQDEAWYKDSVQTGWIGAGSQYFHLVNSNPDKQVLLQDINIVLPTIQVSSSNGPLTSDYARIYNSINDFPVISYFTRARTIINAQQAADVNQRSNINAQQAADVNQRSKNINEDLKDSSYVSELSSLDAITAQMITTLVTGSSLNMKSSVMNSTSNPYLDWHLDVNISLIDLSDNKANTPVTNLTVAQDNLEIMLKKIYGEMLGLKVFTSTIKWNEGDQDTSDNTPINDYGTDYCMAVDKSCDLPQEVKDYAIGKFVLGARVLQNIDPNYDAEKAAEEYGYTIYSDSGSCFKSALDKGCIIERKGLLGSFAALENNQPVDPILITTQLGMTMIDASVTYWIKTTNGIYQAMRHMVEGYTRMMVTTGSVFGTAQGMIAAFAPPRIGTAVGTVVGVVGNILISISKMWFAFDQTVLTIFLPFGAAVALTFFVLGTTLGIYVPLVPFLIYLFSVIGWFIAVIEAMIAAPLVALGVTHPEGHDLLGKAEQSVILLLGVFIRPVTILLGFITAILLINIAMSLLNYGFIGIFASYLANSSSLSETDLDITKLIGSLGVLIVYAYAVINIVDQVFGLIYQVPEKILRWIGAAPEQSGVGQMMGQMRQGVSQSASSAGQGASSAAGRGPNMQPQGELKEAKFGKPDAEGSSVSEGNQNQGSDQP
jgi:conjugal transfer/type IV secretion protein DotA/TraY